VQSSPSLQLAAVGQLPSQVSPDSRTPLPHRTVQSTSLSELQLGAQQPSPVGLVHVVIGEVVHRALHSAAEPVSTSFVQALLSLQLVGQLPSQTSPGSTVPSPQRGGSAGQSWSPRVRVQPEAQQPSPDTQAVIGVLVQVTLHSLAVPVRTSVVHALLSLQVVGQLPSQVSLGSTVPLPHRGVQSTSVFALQRPRSQHWSAVAEHVVTAVFVQVTLHCAAVPVSTSVVHALLSLQLVGQLPSQVSPGSTVPSPQLAEQSLSPGRAQPLGQHESPEVQAVTAACAQTTLHCAAVPVSTSVVQALLSLQLVGQLPSQVSPGSTTPLPQGAGSAGQSLSVLGPQIERSQQASPFEQVVFLTLVQAALQVAALPVSVSVVQALLSLQVVGQLPSQVSPGSTTPLPQLGAQSVSPGREQPEGQHWSPLEQAVTDACVHCTLQVVGLPVRLSVVQALLSSQVAGQLPSQVSPGSTRPSPHVGAVVGWQ